MELALPAELAPTLPEALRLRSEQQPDTVAYVFLRDGETPEETLTYGRLDRAARARAAALEAAGLAGGTAVLLYPSGLEFVAALLGCMYAGTAGAPVQVPTRRRGMERARRIADDAGAKTILTTTAVKREVEEHFADLLTGLTVIDTESLPDVPDDAPAVRLPGPDDVALLQYTSGSTGDPKGVEVTHANFRANVAETVELWPVRSDGTVVNWLPLFHDMGLMFGVVMPLFTGVPAYLMAPQSFIRRPARWLEAISRFRGTHAAAPSFAYELCVRSVADTGLPAGLDLSSWRVAVNGAEPVRWTAVADFTEAYAPAGFRPQAMCPGYGLAENTLKLSGSPEDRPPTLLRADAAALQDGRVVPLTGPGTDGVRLVGSGVTVPSSRVAVVDPGTGTEQPAGRVGEIWINGPCVARGYHGRPAESAESFGARIAGQEARGTWLRTGDLGFLHDGEVFVAGRLKDVVIHQGRNFYPQDIELSAEVSDRALHPNCAAAFALDDGRTERLVLLVEADGRALRNGGADALRARVHDAVWDRQRLRIDEIVLLRRGALPKTSSGKVQRRLARSRYLDGEFGPAPAREA
ncbi:middle chain fatty acyl-CoA ligase [Actinacidiphila reveromycinica]|uniref:Middle chain fatty acyl-CoA ligase n=1 Tax=Actinacidiphila reveromycinica TaxID=659352 RepID=G1UDT9_9ACTN|nr:fatty acyl-AMP ligase [Streptomyces sp. SN-593]BAK64635.1 putative CoA ligase [Streptomyces sp. SN-593]BBB01292.1 middle chain fatty acyl-CoA ligase [Streptomyces sp. SN-593]